MIGPLDDMIQMGNGLLKNNPHGKLVAKLEQMWGDDKFSISEKFCGAWSVAFAELGFPTLRLPPKTVAALAFTDISEIELRAPWPAFMIRVDESVFGEVVDIALIIQKGMASVMASIQEELVFVHGKDSWDDVADMTNRNFSLPFKEGEPAPLSADIVARRARACARIAAGACQLVLNAPPKQTALTPGQRLARKIATKKGLPTLSEYVVGQEVVIDLRESLREYALGHVRHMRSIRWLVRGHWRNQVAGKGRAERRRTWIQPYWKGNQEAATLVRGYTVKGETS